MSLCIVHNGLKVRSDKRAEVIQESRELVLSLELSCVASVISVQIISGGTGLTSLLLVVSHRFEKIASLRKWPYEVVLVYARDVEV